MTFNSEEIKNLPGTWLYDHRNDAQVYVVEATLVRSTPKDKTVKLLLVKSYKASAPAWISSGVETITGQSWFFAEWPENEKKNYREMVKSII